MQRTLPDAHPRRGCRPEARAARTGRSGLAPLELVLSLPLLLCMLALMINFGAAAVWKVRATTAARQAVWRDRVGWQGGGDPQPINWPAPGTMNVDGGDDVDWAAEPWLVPQILHPFAQGPTVVDPEGRGYIRLYNRDPVVMAHGVRDGRAHLRRDLPLIPALPDLEFHLHHQVLDSRWQFHNMGYGWNHARRMKGWYNYESAAEWASQQARFEAADRAQYNNPLKEDLAPLDRDDEFLAYDGFRAPDFYPHLGAGCEIDPRRVYASQIAGPFGLIAHIQGPTGGGRGGVPDRMARAFINLYRTLLGPIADEISRLQAFLQQLQVQLAQLQGMQPPPLDQIAQLQQRIGQLQQDLQGLRAQAGIYEQKIEQLEAFVRTLN